MEPTPPPTSDLISLYQDWQEAAVRIPLNMGAAKDLLVLSEYQDRAQRRWLSYYLWGPTIGRKRRQRRARGRRRGAGL